MAIKIEMLRCFAAVAECGNLAEAASRLSRTPSALSMMLKQLEDHLGQALFESDRKNKLSPVGVFVLEKAQRELKQFDATVKEIERYAHAKTGTIRVASVPSVAATLLPGVLAQFIAAHPQVQIDLYDMDSLAVMRAMLDEKIDIGIATVPDSFQAYQREPLFNDDFGLICAPDNPLSQSSDPLPWQMLCEQTLITNDLCRTIASAEFQQLCDKATMNVHNTLSLIALVKAGLGVTVLPRMVVNLHPGDIVFRPLADKTAVRQIDLLYRAGNTASPVTRVFCDYVIRNCSSLVT